MKLALVANLDKKEVRQVIPDVVNLLQQRGVDFFVEKQLAALLKIEQEHCPGLTFQEIRTQCQLVISFGGDGTILSTAREIGDSNLPILGVKIGGMGFLAELTPTELINHLDDIVKQEFEVYERMVLQAKLGGDKNTTLFALNDFVLDKGAVSRINRIKISIDDEYLNTYIGDGLIISTPTGSTAYSLAAGGPILLPSMEAIIINPINPHTLGARPVVIPANKHIQVDIEFAAHTVILSADGQVAKEMIPGTTATIQRAEHRVRLVSFGRRSFFDVLRAKLNWGDDIRQGKVKNRMMKDNP